VLWTWGQIAEPQPDAWYEDTAKRVYRPEVYLQAARRLVAEGKAQHTDFPFETDGYRPPTADFIDGVRYDGRQPIPSSLRRRTISSRERGKESSRRTTY